jgi:hypothetical protein
MQGDFEELERQFQGAVDNCARVKVLAGAAGDYFGTQHKGVARFLAGVVLSEVFSRDVRLSAYFSLFEVCGRDLWTLRPVQEFKIPDDLDLPFLQECLKN